MTAILIILSIFAAVFGLLGFLGSSSKGSERMVETAACAGVGLSQGCGCIVMIGLILGGIVVFLAIFG